MKRTKLLGLALIVFLSTCCGEQVEAEEGEWIPLPYFRDGSWWLPVDTENPTRIEAQYVALIGRNCYIARLESGEQRLLDAKGHVLARTKRYFAVLGTDRFAFQPEGSEYYRVIDSSGRVDQSYQLTNQQLWELKDSALSNAKAFPHSNNLGSGRTWEVVSNGQVKSKPLALDYCDESRLLAEVRQVGMRGWGSELVIWDVDTRSCVWRIRLSGGYAAPVSVDLSASGRVVVSGGNGKYSFSNFLEIYDLASRSLVKEFHIQAHCLPGYLKSAWLDDGDRVLCLSKLEGEGEKLEEGDGGSLHLLEISTGKRTALVQDLVISSVAPFSNGSLALVGTNKGEVFLINIKSGRRNRVAQFEGSPVSSISISADEMSWAAGTVSGSLMCGPLGVEPRLPKAQLPNRVDGEVVSMAISDEVPPRIIARAAGNGGTGFFGGVSVVPDQHAESIVWDPSSGQVRPFDAGFGAASLEGGVVALGLADGNGIRFHHLPSDSEVGVLGVRMPGILERSAYTGSGTRVPDQMRMNEDGTQLYLSGRLLDFREMRFVENELERDLKPPVSERELQWDRAQGKQREGIKFEDAIRQGAELMLEPLRLGVDQFPAYTLLYSDPHTLASFTGISPGGTILAVFSQWKGSGNLRLVDQVAQRVMSQPSGGKEDEELSAMSDVGWVQPVDEKGRRLLLVGMTDGMVRMIDYVGGETLSVFDFGGEVGGVTWSPSDQRIYIATDDAAVHCVTWDDEGKLQPVGRIDIVSDDQFVASLPSGEFMGSGGEELRAVTTGRDAFPLDRAAAFLHQPHQVAKAFGASGSMVELLEKAYLRRCRRDGLEPIREIPQNLEESLRVELSTSSSSIVTNLVTCEIAVVAESSKAELRRLPVHINGVPLHDWDSAVVSGRTKWEGSIVIPLNPGSNLIQVSAIDEEGNESLRKTVRLSRVLPQGEVKDLYILALGVSDYQDDRLDLAAAAKDARDFSAYLEGLEGGVYQNVHAKVLTDAQVTREILPKGKQFLDSARENDDVIVFVAGHGFVDSTGLQYWFGTHGVDVDRVDEEGISYEELEGLFQSSASRQRLMLMDTCFAGEIDHTDVSLVEVGDGIVVRAPAITKVISKPPDGSFDLMKELFADLRRSSGISVLTASSGMEFVFAEERPEGDNGVFTYCLLEGLETGRGDVDGDGAITISDLNTFLGNRVPEMTGGRQRPTGRSLNREADFSIGSAEVRPHFEAREFVDNYLSLTSRNGMEEKMADLFAERVDYFGNVKSPAQIVVGEIDYHRKFPQRHFSIDQYSDGVTAEAVSDDEYKVIYSIQFGMSDSQGKYKGGKQTLEMKVNLVDSAWRISSLKVLKSEIDPRYR